MGILSILGRVAKPLLGTIISKPSEGESLMQKNFRPYVAAAFMVLILLNEFTSYVMSDGLLEVSGLVIGMLFATRTSTTARGNTRYFAVRTHSKLPASTAASMDGALSAERSTE